jgi:hypothetical protein
MKNKLNKNILVYGLVMMLLISLISLLQAVDVSKLDLLYYGALVLVSGTGIAHVIALNRLLRLQSFGTGLSISIAIMTFATGASAMIYRYSSLNLGFLTFIFAFIIPYLCWHAYLHFREIMNSI